MEPAAAPPLVFPAPCTEEFHEGKPKFMFCTKHMQSGCLACMLEDHAAPPCVAVNMVKNPQALGPVVAAYQGFMASQEQRLEAAAQVLNDAKARLEEAVLSVPKLREAVVAATHAYWEMEAFIESLKKVEGPNPEGRAALAMEEAARLGHALAPIVATREEVLVVSSVDSHRVVMVKMDGTVHRLPLAPFWQKICHCGLVGTILVCNNGAFFG